MPNTRASRRDADRLWGAFGVGFGASFVVWVVAWIATAISEQDERCGHGIVGPGGSFRVEETSFPPNVSCVFADGTTLDSSGLLVWVFWVCVVVTGTAGAGALSLELLGVRGAQAAARLGRLAVFAGGTLLAVYLLALFSTGSPGSTPLESCSAFTTGIYERAQDVRRAPFPAQATCVYGDGRTYELVPRWMGGVQWVLLGVVIVCAGGAVRAGRRQMSSSPASP
ncbi:hypothetical protein [Streptomyces sp. NPDC058247]|uniref:hypothetical protein n=1 Tax=Streptomyces sp. NPDC058247 TaxID=3346401 RepID=UPI0036E20E58